MTRMCKSYFLRILLVINSINNVLNQVQMAQFETFGDTDYIVSVAHNTIANITDKSVHSVVGCGKQCLKYSHCEAATYYSQTKTCSLYGEKCGVGQRIHVGPNIASVTRVDQNDVHYGDVYGSLRLKNGSFSSVYSS
jgi:hypothetical protein